MSQLKMWKCLSKSCLFVFCLFFCLLFLTLPSLPHQVPEKATEKQAPYCSFSSQEHNKRGWAEPRRTGPSIFKAASNHELTYYHNFLSPCSYRNPDNTSADTLWTLIELHTRLGSTLGGSISNQIKIKFFHHSVSDWANFFFTMC